MQRTSAPAGEPAASAGREVPTRATRGVRACLCSIVVARTPAHLSHLKLHCCTYSSDTRASALNCAQARVSRLLHKPAFTHWKSVRDAFASPFAPPPPPALALVDLAPSPRSPAARHQPPRPAFAINCQLYKQPRRHRAHPQPSTAASTRRRLALWRHTITPSHRHRRAHVYHAHPIPSSPPTPTSCKLLEKKVQSFPVLLVIFLSLWSCKLL